MDPLLSDIPIIAILNFRIKKTLVDGGSYFAVIIQDLNCDGDRQKHRRNDCFNQSSLELSFLKFFNKIQNHHP